jgi:hypothetical protein
MIYITVSLKKWFIMRLDLNNGFVDGKQIFPVEWVEETTMIFEIRR